MIKRKKQEKYFTNEIAPHYDDLYRFLLRLGCDSSTAQDIAQETLEAAWESVDELMNIDYAICWIFKVARNKYYSYARLAFHKYEYSDEGFILSDYENSKTINDIANIIIINESHEIIEKALDMIDDKYSDLIRMRYFGDLSYHEMSEKLGVNENTIRSAIMRGTRKLEKILTELGYIKEDM